MSNMVFTPKWNTAINQLERNEYATGGADGNMNTAPKQLAENIWFLRDELTGVSGDLSNFVVSSELEITRLDEKNILQDTLIQDNKTAIESIGSIAGEIGAASTTKAGIVQLSNSTSSTSNALAATPSAVKSAFDKANAALPSTQKGAANGVASLGSDGKVPSSQLPSFSLTNFYPNTTTEPPNTYIDSTGTLRRSNNFLNAASRKVGKGADELVAYDYEGGFGEVGYIKAGFNAPKLAFMKVTGYLSNSTSTLVSPPVDFSKIIGVQIFAKAEGYWYTGHDVTAANVLTISLISAGLFIKHGTRMQGAEYKILITYEV